MDNERQPDMCRGMSRTELIATAQRFEVLRHCKRRELEIDSAVEKRVRDRERENRTQLKWRARREQSQYQYRDEARESCRNRSDSLDNGGSGYRVGGFGGVLQYSPRVVHSGASGSTKDSQKTSSTRALSNWERIGRYMLKFRIANVRQQQ